MRDDPRVVALVKRAAEGDQEAWGAIVERYSPLVYTICVRYRLSSHDIEDVAQNVWLLLLEHIGELREPAALPGWIATTTARECIRIVMAAYKSVPLTMDFEELTEWQSDFPPPLRNQPVLPVVPSAEDTAQVLLDRQELIAAFRDLPVRLQRLIMHYYADLPQAELASGLRFSRSFAERFTARDRAILRVALKEFEYRPEPPEEHLRHELRIATGGIGPYSKALETIRNRASHETPHQGATTAKDSHGQSEPGEAGLSFGPESGEPEPNRYLIGEFPGRVRVGAEFSLIVSITSGPPDHGVAATPLSDLAVGPEGVRVTFVIRPDTELLTLGDLQQTVVVPQYRDSPPARFVFRARTVGLSRIRVTSWLGGTFLAELRLEVSVESDTPLTDSRRNGAPLGPLQADPGEVTLQVHFDGGQYSFQLLSQRYLFGPVLAKSLTEKPGQAVERTVAMLRRMAREESGYPPPLAARWVRETGIGLWRDLVPISVQDQFWQLRGSITAFTIACDDDTMPWELLYPLAPNQDDGFLVEQFPVSRRVYDQSRSHRVWIGDARYVIPPGSPTNAHDEVAAICRILAQPTSPPITELAGLLDMLDAGSAGMLHFACHNTFCTEGGGSSIAMADGRFVPQLLNSAVARRCLASYSPLIFVNACRSAGVSSEYTQMMGWASQFMAAGAGAFIGTLWPVRSSKASLFAEAFYAALVAGTNLGAATLNARRSIKDDSDPTWLAYTVYGDPAAFGALRA